MSELTTWDIAGNWYQPFLSKPIEECTKEEVAAVRLQGIQTIADHTPDLVFVKTHNALVADRGVPMINFSVTAGAIYIIRNPLDVAISYSHHLNCTIDESIERLNTRGVQTSNRANHVYEVQSSWNENVYSWTRKPNPSLMVVRYEDLSEKPVSTFRELVNFLAIESTTAEIEDAIEQSGLEKLKSQEEKHGFREKPPEAKQFFRKGQVGEWKEVLTEQQVDNIVSANYDLMAAYHYLPE